MLELASWGVACRDGPPTPASGRRTQSSRVSGTLRQIEGLEYESTIHPTPLGFSRCGVLGSAGFL
jgi:hypothetical protein